MFLLEVAICTGIAGGEGGLVFVGRSVPEQLQFSQFVEVYFSEGRIRVDDLEQILVYLEVIGSFLAEGAFPLLD